MAAPNNLSLHSPFSSSTQQQSLRTPDANSLFSSSSSLPTPHDISIPNVNDASSVNSLEDLLSFSGITNGPAAPPKRHIDGVELPGSKRVKLDSQPQDHIPSILPHTTSNLIPSILSSSKSQSLPVSSSHVPVSSTLNGGVILPLLKPPLNLSSTPVTSGNKGLPNVSSQPSVSMSDISHTAASTVAQTNGGSVALLVQLYKHFQSTGDSAGMAKIHQQLLELHSQLATKAGAYLSSLTTTPGAASSLFQTGVNQTNNNSVSIDTHNQSTNLVRLSSSLSGLANNIITTTATTTGGFQMPSSGTPLHNSTVDKSSQPITGNIGSTSSNVPKSQRLSSISSLPPPYSSSSSTPATTVLTNPLQFLTGNLSTLINQVSKQHTTSIDTTPKLSYSSTTHATSPSIVTHASPSSQSSLPLTLSPSLPLPTLPPTLSSTASTGLSPLSGLQVTAQTQANVLRAVYSYRIQRIQEFLASLPADQRPTTTQELRELLTKNNILTKAFPPDIINNLQQQLPLTSSLAQSIPVQTTSTTASGVSSSMVINTLPTGTSTSDRNTTLSTSVPLNSNSLSSSTPSTSGHSTAISNSGHSTTIGSSLNSVSSSNSAINLSSTTPANQSISTSVTTSTTTSSLSSSSGPLPGVTLETLRTLCRLPEADLIRIPMPSMLLTVVQYMRANKWNGTSSDLPLLIQQAQDALAKGKQNTATPPAPLPTSGIKSTSQNQSKQPAQQPKLSNPSPLSQYMASVGIKVPSSISSVKSNSKPLPISLQNTTNHNKLVPEQSEKDRLAALQKVLQSSEEARIAFRFQAHLDKLHQQISTHEIQRPFSTWQDLILRLLPYHIYREPELPPGAMEKADAVYEGIAGVLLSRSQGLMSQYQQILLREEQRRNEEECTSLVLERLWLEGERERKEQEEKQKREAEQIAAELSAVGSGAGSSTSFLDSTDPFLLNSDSYDDYSFLDQFWGDDLTTDGLGDTNNFDLGIT